MGKLAEAALRRHRLVTLVCLALLVLLAWAWIAAGAGMSAGPAMNAMAMPRSHSSGVLVFAMWLVMMVAMMLPSAAPAVLLYARAAAHGAAPDAPAPPTAAFVGGYLLVWSAFAAVATLLHLGLERTGVLAMETMGLANRWLSGGVLFAAGVYQLTPLKRACLARCRSPAEFLSLHYRPGAGGALRLGLIHGAYCLGCCWALMLLLFVGGVMNLAWIAALTMLVGAEKLLPWGRGVARVSGAALLVTGAAVLFA